MGNIVVGVDGSEGASLALQWAVREAKLRGSTVVAVLTWGYLDQHHADGSTEFKPQYGEDDARAAIEAFVAAGVEDRDGVEIECRPVNDLQAPGLLSAGEGADLLVVGARGLGGFRGLLLGSVSQQVLHHATCPVAVVRDIPTDRSGADGRVVVGVDGSPTSLSALAWALDEGRARQVVVEVVHGVQPMLAGAFPYAAHIDERATEEAVNERLDAILAEADTSGLVGPVERSFHIEGPRSGLLASAERADLVVVGSRGVGGFKGMLLGSVSHAVAQHAPCPVIVMPKV